MASGDREVTQPQENTSNSFSRQENSAYLTANSSGYTSMFSGGQHRFDGPVTNNVNIIVPTQQQQADIYKHLSQPLSGQATQDPHQQSTGLPNQFTQPLGQPVGSLTGQAAQYPHQQSTGLPNQFPQPSDQSNGQSTGQAQNLTQEQKELLMGWDVTSCHLVDLAREIEWNIPRLIDLLDISYVRYKLITRDHPKRFVFYILYDWMKKEECWEKLYNAMTGSGISTEHFFRIIQGEDTIDNERTINACIEEINKCEDDCLLLSSHQFAALSKCFGAEYWEFGIRLGFTESEMQMTDEDNIYMFGKISSMLNLWFKRMEPLRKFIRAVVLSGCYWPAIRKILIDAEVSNWSLLPTKLNLIL